MSDVHDRGVASGDPGSASVWPTLDYAPMLLSDVFETMTSSKAWFDKSKMTVAGEPIYPFISRTGRGNGVDGFFPRQQSKALESGNAITLGLDTQTFGYQPVPFYTSQNIQVMRHSELDEATALVLIAVMNAQMSKFSWGGNGATLGRLKKTHVMVPAITDDDGEMCVDWEGMRSLGQRLMEQAEGHCSGMDTFEPPEAEPVLDYAPMAITDVFETVRASGAWFDGNKLRGGEGEHVYVSRSGRRNGYERTVARQDTRPNAGNAVTIGVDTQTVFYQPMPFYTSVKIQVLRHPQLTAASGLVLVALLRAQMRKFQWGNGVSLDRLRATQIMVPVATSVQGEQVVDWEGMEAYGHWLGAAVEGRSHEAWEIAS